MKLDLEKIRIVNGPGVLATVEDVDNAAAKLGISFPPGYSEYVTKLGEGILGDFIRIYPPWRIVAELDDWRDRIRQYWFWDEGADVLTDEQAEESIIVGDTLNGDELIFHPSNPERILVLPRDEEVIIEAGKSLQEAVSWLCSSGKLTEEFSVNEFEPFDSRVLRQETRAQSSQSRKAQENDPCAPHPENTVLAPGVAVKSPDQVLREFFLALEAWEEKALADLHTEADESFDEDQYDAALASVYEDFRRTVKPFITDDFDIGKPCSFGSPAQYGRTGPQIVDTHISGETAEIVTKGDNMSSSDRSQHLFRLVHNGESWRVNGVWQITKSGRRKRVKMFL